MYSPLKVKTELRDSPLYNKLHILHLPLWSWIDRRPGRLPRTGGRSPGAAVKQSANTAITANTANTANANKDTIQLGRAVNR